MKRSTASLIAVVALLIAGAIASSAPQPTVFADASKLYWPAEPYSFIPADMLGTAPDVPVLEPRIVHPRPDGKLVPTDEKVLRARVIELIASHPNQALSLDLTNRIQRGAFDLGFITHPFVKEMATFGVRSVPTDHGEVALPVMSFNLKVLMCPLSAYLVRGVHVIITHEYQHFLQWQIATPQERAYLSVNPLDEIDSAYWAYRWRIEREAYMVQCQHAIAWGMPKFDHGLCQHLTAPRAFDRRVFLKLAHGLSTPAQYALAVVANHPHPEAFAASSN